MRLPYSSLCRFRSFFAMKQCMYSSGKPSNVENTSSWKEPAGHLTPISLYNSVCKKKVRFKTRLKGVVSWYACGPTVYDSAHIGHACCYVYQDVIRRVMEDMFDLNIMMVMGVTDIDDKIIAAAASSGKEAVAVSRHYEKEFFNDLSQLNIRPPTVTARVTDYIPQIISFVEKLYDKGFAYTTSDGSVYFRVEKFGGYGKLHPAESDAGETEGQAKESRRDFALWKGAKPGEPYWSSPWGNGRPGWHIECSTIASCLLGHEIDLHSGGLDLMFPHHENEEAQSCCHHGVHQWVNYWLHTGHLKLAGDVKMSKSLKNTVSISEFLRNYSSDELRMFCLLTRYRHGIEFSDRMMESAVSVCRKLDNFLSDCNTCIKDPRQFGRIDEPLLLKCLTETQLRVVEALSNDFDTPRALSHIFHLVSTVNKMLHHSDSSVGEMGPVVGLGAVRNYIISFLKMLGCLAGKQDGKQTEMESILNSSVTFRSQVRSAALKITKQHPKESLNLKKELLSYCDDYRKILLVDGVEIKDLGEKSSWNTVRKV